MGRLARDGGRVEHVEAFDRAGSGGVIGRSERCDRNHRSVRAAYEEKVQVVPIGTVGRLGLNINPVNAVEHIEVVDINGTGERFHCGKNVGKSDALHLRLVAVHVEIQLRNVSLHGRCQSGKLRRCPA